VNFTNGAAAGSGAGCRKDACRLSIGTVTVARANASQVPDLVLCAFDIFELSQLIRQCYRPSGLLPLEY
jgi:hypothetical protein